jgi:putative inorganic carbon (hco3(-)) transporter
LGVVLVGLLVPSARERIGDLGEGRTRRGTAGNSLVWRTDYWRQVASLGTHSPVTGIGLDMTEYAGASSRPPHNDFLRVFVEMGAVGVVAYLGFLGALAATARRALRTAPSGIQRGLAVAFTGCLVAAVVNSVGGNLLGQVVLLWYLFAFAAVAAAIAPAR